MNQAAAGTSPVVLHSADVPSDQLEIHISSEGHEGIFGSAPGMLTSINRANTGHLFERSNPRLETANADHDLIHARAVHTLQSAARYAGAKEKWQGEEAGDLHSSKSFYRSVHKRIESLPSTTICLPHRRCRYGYD